MLPRQGLLRASQRSTSLTVGAQAAKLHAMLCIVSIVSISTLLRRFSFHHLALHQNARSTLHSLVIVPASMAQTLIPKNHNMPWASPAHSQTLYLPMEINTLVALYTSVPGSGFLFLAIYCRAVLLAASCYTITTLPNNAPESLYKKT